MWESQFGQFFPKFQNHLLKNLDMQLTCKRKEHSLREDVCFIFSHICAKNGKKKMVGYGLQGRIPLGIACVGCELGQLTAANLHSPTCGLILHGKFVSLKGCCMHARRFLSTNAGSNTQLLFLTALSEDKLPKHPKKWSFMIMFIHFPKLKTANLGIFTLHQPLRSRCNSRAEWGCHQISLPR